MNCRTLVKEFMKERGLSVEGLAFKSGRSYSTVANWLAGRDIGEDTLQDFANALEVPVEQLTRMMTGRHNQKAAV